MPDEGKVEWAKNVRVGYLDQHTVLDSGNDHPRGTGICLLTYLFEMEEQMNDICDKMGDCYSGRAGAVLMEELGTIQDTADHA